MRVVEAVSLQTFEIDVLIKQKIGVAPKRHSLKTFRFLHDLLLYSTEIPFVNYFFKKSKTCQNWLGAFVIIAVFIKASEENFS